MADQNVFDVGGRRRTKLLDDLGAPVVAALAALFVAGVGGQLTDLGPWYAALLKPSWQPPGIAFPLAWTLVFTLTAISGVIGWRRAPSEAARKWLIALFAVNGALNILWSGLFFTLQRPDWALAEAGFLWLSILALILFLGRIAPLAGWLNAPYLVWVSIATLLNWEIVRLNGAFG